MLACAGDRKMIRLIEISTLKPLTFSVDNQRAGSEKAGNKKSINLGEMKNLRLSLINKVYSTVLGFHSPPCIRAKAGIKCSSKSSMEHFLSQLK